MPYSLAFRLGAAYVEARHFDLVNAGDYAQYVRNIKGNRVANEVLLDAIGLTLRPELDNDYYRERISSGLALRPSRSAGACSRAFRAVRHLASCGRQPD